ncbi:hypothetical protein B0H67DRAFT_48166 [Lasiosphaeris hirsuta]|uniref:SET domain-containing protein n=1 Tax=Lasiosphaeris hirsuta TaxID=260670 RepID=A0AA40BAP0_9PEZI|nr:hypothetical protein B0H67DRAFT_48166 [Lasiosphaeris hirsuta]
MATSEPPTSGEAFDASKMSKAPSKFLRNAPQDAPAVRVGFVNAAVGYGLFAARDLCKDEFILHEAPLLTALFNEKFSSDKNLVQSQHAAYRNALVDGNRDVITLAFPRLAARNGFAPLPFDDAHTVLEMALGKNLIHGLFGGSTVTREQYEAYTSKIDVAAAPSEEDCRRACLDFFKHYAFEVKKAPTAVAVLPATTSAAAAVPATRDACIYLLGSLINHCCTPPSHGYAFGRGGEMGPNCEWRIGPSGLAQFIRPKHICVQAKRDIKEGEQLTWDYGKRFKGFVCECSTCRDSFMGYYCGVL